MFVLIAGGAAGGLVLGYVLQRSQLCFHAAFRGLLERHAATFKAWVLGVSVAAVGLALLGLVDPWSMSSALPLNPVRNIVGGLVFGAGMAVAASCVSGLFYKLGAGMAGGLVGLTALAVGELIANRIPIGGERVLTGRDTLPTLLGLPRIAVAAALLVVIAVLLARTRRERPDKRWQWGWPAAGVALGLATTWTWVTAGAAGVSFGASTVGATSSVTNGSPDWWQLAFLAAIVAGSAVAAVTSGGWWLRGETRVRYAQLAAGGLLLGAGARWAGGCNLGHALSGMAQLNLSSMLVVASMIAGIAAIRPVQARLGRQGPRQDPAYRALSGG